MTNNLRPYKTYRFHGDIDPVIRVFETVRADVGYSLGEVAKIGGPTYNTMRRWANGETHRPQFATIAAAFGALGYERIEFVGGLGGRQTLRLHGQARVRGPARQIAAGTNHS